MELEQQEGVGGEAKPLNMRNVSVNASRQEKVYFLLAKINS